MSADVIDQDRFRAVIGHFANGVTVVTCRDGETDHGMTASIASSLSVDPSVLLVCMNKDNPTAAAVAATGRFVVNILRESQAHLALQFATPSEDKFAGLFEARARCGARILSSTLAHLECRVDEIATGGTHFVFLSGVELATTHEGAPLAYLRGSFGRLDPGSDDGVYMELRERVLSRHIPRWGSLR